MRIVFMGTPEFSCPALEAILKSAHDVLAVYTRAPKPAGRGKKEQKTPIHILAEQNNVSVHTPQSLKSEQEIETIKAYAPDLIIVIAYGMLLPKAILEIPPFGCINVHASLLPRWRGAAPIQRAIMAGDKQSGVCIMQMEEGLDTGPVGLVKCIDITPEHTSKTLHDDLSDLGSHALMEALVKIENKTFELKAQSENGITYAKKIDKEESHINWDMPNTKLLNFIHGLSPFPGAWSQILTLEGTCERIKFLQVELSDQILPAGFLDPLTHCVGTQSGSIKILTIQRQGKAAMSAQECFRGLKLPPLCELK